MIDLGHVIIFNEAEVVEDVDIWGVAEGSSEVEGHLFFGFVTGTFELVG